MTTGTPEGRCEEIAARLEEATPGPWEIGRGRVNVHFSSASVHWATPEGLYQDLNKEFNFNDDPCPLHGEGGLDRRWGSRTFCNPPYGRSIAKWTLKALKENERGSLVVLLVPSRTDTRWWHEHIMLATEIRFLRGRLTFGDATNTAPFPSCLAIYSPDRDH
jgi:hypothetical protein